MQEQAVETRHHKSRKKNKEIEAAHSRDHEAHNKKKKKEEVDSRHHKSRKQEKEEEVVCSRDHDQEQEEVHSGNQEPLKQGQEQEAVQSRHRKPHKHGKEKETVHSRHHKSQEKEKSISTKDSKSSCTPTASDPYSFSSPLALFPAQASSTTANAGSLSLDSWQTDHVRSTVHEDSLEDQNESLATPGAFPVHGRNSPSAVVNEKMQGNRAIHVETENVDDASQVVVTAKVVPDEEDLMADMKKRLEKEIEEEVAMRLMAEGQTAVVAEAVSANAIQKAQRQTWACLFLVFVLIIVGIVVAVVVTKDHNDSTTTCLGATTIKQGQTAISSWINPVTGPGELQFSSVCTNSYVVPAPNTWFSLVGTGDVYAVSTCSRALNFDSALSVGTGSTGMCDNLQCIAYADSTSGECPESTYGAATVLFRTDVGVTYYIGVEGINNPSQGNFTLSITKVVAPQNSDCSEAIVIKPGERLKPGTFKNATHDMHFNYPCQWTAGLPSVWYSLVGTGDVFNVFDPNMTAGSAVSTGSCEKLECLVNDVDQGTYLIPPDILFTEIPQRGNFRSEVGVEYFLQVYPAWNESSTGEFTLFISSGQPPANGHCSSASMVQAGTSSVLGSTLHAAWDSNMNTTCSFSGWETPVVWYSLIGTGDVYAISTCSSALNFDSTISVLTGACESLECLIPGWAAQLDCPEASFYAGSTRLRTEIGVEYFIAVEPTNLWEGNFSLEVSIFEPAPNDECSGALDIQANNGTIHGTTMDATPSTNGMPLDSLFGIPSPDLWYRFIGNGKNTTASLCDEEIMFDSVIHIFERDGDSCDQMLIAENDDFCDVASEVSWIAELGVTYYIRVSSFDGRAGHFGLTLSDP